MGDEVLPKTRRRAKIVPLGMVYGALYSTWCASFITATQNATVEACSMPHGRGTYARVIPTFRLPSVRFRQPRCSGVQGEHGRKMASPGMRPRAEAEEAEPRLDDHCARVYQNTSESCTITGEMALRKTVPSKRRPAYGLGGEHEHQVSAEHLRAANQVGMQHHHGWRAWPRIRCRRARSRSPSHVTSDLVGANSERAAHRRQWLAHRDEWIVACDQVPAASGTKSKEE